MANIINPFNIFKKLRQYKAICKRQCLALSNANEHIAELIAENQQIKQELEQIKKETKNEQ